MPKGKINWVKWGVIINAIMLLVLFLTVFNVDLSLPSYPKPEYSITTLEQPFPLYPEKRPPLNCSPLYYTEIIVEKPNSVYYGDNLEISVIMKNRGKKPSNFIAFGLIFYAALYPTISIPPESPALGMALVLFLLGSGCMAFAIIYISWLARKMCSSTF